MKRFFADMKTEQHQASGSQYAVHFKQSYRHLFTRQVDNRIKCGKAVERSIRTTKRQHIARLKFDFRSQLSRLLNHPRGNIKVVNLDAVFVKKPCHMTWAASQIANPFG